MTSLFKRFVVAGFLFAAFLASLSASAEDARESIQPNAKAVAQANRPFAKPEMTPPSKDEKSFAFTDVGAKIPNYTPGARWGTQDAPLTLMQDPVPAEESIKAYSVPQDFHLSLWAKESNKNWPNDSQAAEKFAGLTGKPIAMNWDERGRLWVCETVDYPNELQSSPGQGRDRIKICEDTDNDGQADKFTVFAQHLSIPSTLVCYRGGVIVQNGATTIYLKDIDGDDVADFRQELITGWAMGDTHGGVSNFQYGPDNWIWGMQGYNNSEPIINGEPQMRFRQGFWRFKVRSGAADETAPAYALDKQSGLPADQATSQFNEHTIRVDALEFMRATNNNTWGLGFSEEGYVFGSTANGCPSVHMPIPNRYFDQVAGWSPKHAPEDFADGQVQCPRPEDSPSRLSRWLYRGRWWCALHGTELPVRVVEQDSNGLRANRSHRWRLRAGKRWCRIQEQQCLQRRCQHRRLGRSDHVRSRSRRKRLGARLVQLHHPTQPDAERFPDRQGCGVRKRPA